MVTVPLRVSANREGWSSLRPHSNAYTFRNGKVIREEFVLEDRRVRVRYWPFSDIQHCPLSGRYWWDSGHRNL